MTITQHRTAPAVLRASSLLSLQTKKCKPAIPEKQDIHLVSNSFRSFYFQELINLKKNKTVPYCNKPNPAVYPCSRVPQWCSVLAPPPTRTPSNLSALGFEPRTLCVSVDYMLYITRRNTNGRKKVLHC